MRHWTAVPIAGVLVLVLAALTAGVLHPGFVRDLDWQLHGWIDAHLQGDIARAASTVASWFGQRGVVVIPLLVAALLAARRHRSARPVLVTLATLGGIAVTVLLFKVGVGRVAPGAGRDGVHAGGLSYPSGHAVNALVCWALLLELLASLGNRPARVLTPRRRLTIATLAALAAGIGMTTLDYHWFSDTIAGWLVGVLILGVVLAIRPVRAAPADALNPTVARAPARPAPSA